MAKFYRMPLDAVETAKITQLMYLIDHSKMNEGQRLNLNEVDTVISRDKKCTYLATRPTSESDRNFPDFYSKAPMSQSSMRAISPFVSPLPREASTIEGKGEQFDDKRTAQG